MNARTILDISIGKNNNMFVRYDGDLFPEYISTKSHHRMCCTSPTNVNVVVDTIKTQQWFQQPVVLKVSGMCFPTS